MGKILYEGCILELDQVRGVLYVHNKEGRTILRLQHIREEESQTMAKGDLLDYNLKRRVGPAAMTIEQRFAERLHARFCHYCPNQRVWEYEKDDWGRIHHKHWYQEAVAVMVDLNTSLSEHLLEFIPFVEKK